jgi:hypothetical protein
MWRISASTVAIVTNPSCSSTHERGPTIESFVKPCDLTASRPTGDRIADTVAVALEPVEGTATFYKKSLRVLVDGQEVAADPQNGCVYDELTHSIRFQGAAKKKAFTAKIDIIYKEHL